MHYEVILGQPNPEGYALVIERAHGDYQREEVRLSPTGNVTAMISRWRSEDGPFEAHIEDCNGKIMSKRIKLRLLERLVLPDTPAPLGPRSTPAVTPGEGVDRDTAKHSQDTPHPLVPRSTSRVTVGEAVDRNTAKNSDEEYYRKRAAARKLPQ
jgi:hypothetical protein